MSPNKPTKESKAPKLGRFATKEQREKAKSPDVDMDALDAFIAAKKKAKPGAGKP
jgi:hypothetical protein